MKHADQKIIEVKVTQHNGKIYLDKINVYTVVYTNKSYVYAKTPGTDSLNYFHTDQTYWRSICLPDKFFRFNFDYTDVGRTIFILVDRTNINVVNEYISKYIFKEDSREVLKREIKNIKSSIERNDSTIRNNKRWAESKQKENESIEKHTEELLSRLSCLEETLKKFEEKDKKKE